MAKRKQRPFDGITPAYEILLRGTDEMPIGLHQLHLATAEQLCRPHYKMGCLKDVKRKLCELCKHHYVQFDAMPTKFTRSPYYYALDTLGMKFLHQAGKDVSEAFRAGKEVDKFALFVQHTLELNDIIIAAALLKRADPNYWLEDFIHERVLKRHPYKWEARSPGLISDAFLDFRVTTPSGQRRMPVVIEHDRGTEEQRNFKRHIRGYITMLRKEGYKELFNVKGITIAFTTSAGAARLQRIREWTWQELQTMGVTGLYKNSFYFTLFEPPLDPCQLWLDTSWYTLNDNQRVSLLEV